MSQKYDVLTFGEILLRYSPPGSDRLLTSPHFIKSPAGSELNVAVGLSQLGLKSAVVCKIPDNPLTGFILCAAAGYGVSCDEIIFDPSPAARLGIYYYESASSPRKPGVIYDRKFSSINSIREADLPVGIFGRARVFHTSGITLGLGQNPRETAILMIRRFKEEGALISFDVNFRANLWQDFECRAAIEPILSEIDILFVSEESLRRMFGRSGELKNIVKDFSKEYGIPYIYSTSRTVRSPKNHLFGATAYDAKKDLVYTAEPIDIEVVDRIGSGDAFASGALCGLLSGEGIPDGVDFGCAMAALKCTVPGDFPSTSLKEVWDLVKSRRENLSSGEMNR